MSQFDGIHLRAQTVRVNLKSNKSKVGKKFDKYTMCNNDDFLYHIIHVVLLNVNRVIIIYLHIKICIQLLAVEFAHFYFIEDMLEKE